MTTATEIETWEGKSHWAPTKAKNYASDDCQDRSIGFPRMKALTGYPGLTQSHTRTFVNNCLQNSIRIGNVHALLQTMF